MSLPQNFRWQGIFPDPAMADENGLLALGGSLEPDWLLEAYCSGVFPWFSEGDPILWWSPDPRMVLFPEELKVSKSLRQRLRRTDYTFRIDQNFDGVIRACAEVDREGSSDTWITEEMIEAYTELHRIGFAHSYEIWLDDVLAGGLYGVEVGRMFFGESMFHKQRDASKIALVHLCREMVTKGVALIDVQMHTEHLESLGARLIPRNQYLKILRNNIELGR